jgi:hypothetical protein
VRRFSIDASKKWFCKKAIGWDFSMNTIPTAYCFAVGISKSHIFFKKIMRDIK